MGNNVKSDVVVLSKTGKVKNRYHLSEPQYGITYFGKSVSDINLAEASLIAGLFQAPNAYNPFKNPSLL